MTNNQPEALRLADIIENKYIGFWQLPEAAAELRRLHEELISANRRAEYWKAEHLAGNRLIEELNRERTN